MKKLALGTISQSKQDILAGYLNMNGFNEYVITPCNVSSCITEQPLDEKTTIKGAINRARRALEKEPDSNYGIGLEAGLVEIENKGYFLVCVCALLERNGEIHLGISDKTPLPDEVSKGIKSGKSFSKLIREYHDACESEKKKEWASRLISREIEFSDAINRAFFSSNTNL